MSLDKRALAGFLSIIVALGAGALGELDAAPQTFNTALPVAEGNIVFRQQLMYFSASGDPGPADRDVRVAGGASMLGYGINSRLAVFGALPYLDKRMKTTPDANNRIRRSTRGIGDARLWARYTVIQRDAPGRTLRLAPFAGIEVPTGRDNDNDRLGRLPQPLQVGSGSLDPFFGVVATYQTLEYQIDAQAGYEVNTEANRFESGDEIRFDGSVQYRLWPRELGPGLPGFVYGVLELNYSDRGKNRIDGVRDSDSGGSSLMVSPGLQYVARRWVVEGIVQIPVVQNLNGTALEDDLTVLAGFRLTF